MKKSPRLLDRVVKTLPDDDSAMAGLTSPTNSRYSSLATPPSSLRARATLWASAALVTLLAVSFAPVSWNGFIWDDNMYVTQNPTLRDWDGLRKIWFEPGATPQYYPLVFTSFWVEHHLWGDRPLGYHIVNVALHAAASLLFARLLLVLGANPWTAWTAAGLFAVHPMTVESVAWVSERKNVLSLALGLAAVLTYLASDQRRLKSRKDAAPWMLYGISLLLFTLALLSKTVIATAAPVLLLLVWWRHGRPDVRELARLSPFFLLGLLLGLVTVWMETTHVGASGREWDLTVAQRSIIAGNAAWFYLGKLFWPEPLIFVYPRWEVEAFGPLDLLYPMSVVVIVVLLAVLGRWMGWLPLIVCLSYLALLFPALGFLDVYPFRYSFVADHFAYHASLPVIAGVVLVVAAIRRPAFAPIVGRVAAFLAIGILAVVTFDRCRVFESAETVWLDTIREDKNPKAWIAYNNLGNIAEYRAVGVSQETGVFTPSSGNEVKGYLDAAIRYYRKALRWNPDDAVIRYNLGRVLLFEGDARAAMEQLDRAVELDPTLPPAHHTLGVAKLQLGEFTGAEASFREAIRRQPKLPLAHLHLGDLLLRTHRIDQAVTHLRIAVELRPELTQWSFLLADALRQAGQDDEAIEAYRTALKDHTANSEAHFHLAECLLRRGRTREAIEEFRAAIALRPDWVDPVAELAWTLARTRDDRLRDPERAKRLADQAHRMSKGENARVLQVLAAAHAALGDRTSAIRHAETALGLAREQTQSCLAEEIEKELGLYRASTAPASTGF